jgi:hypothetical protein
VAVILDQAAANLLDQASGTIQDQQSPPSAVTLPVSGLTLVTYTSTTATLNGFVSPFGLTTTWSFDWGQTPSYGKSAAGGTVTVPGLVAVTLVGLPGGTELHYRIRAASSLGTVLGADQDFISAGRQPGPVLPPSAPAGAVLGPVLPPSSPAGNPGTQA